MADPAAAGSASPGEQQFWTVLEQGDMAALAGMLGMDEPLREDMPLGTVLAKLSTWRQRERELAPLGDAPDAGGESTAGPEALGWVRQLAGLCEPEQRELMLELVRKEIAEMLGYPSVDPVHPTGDVFEMGMTSMSAVQLRERINEQTGLKLPEGFVYDLYMPEAISDFLLSELSATS